MSGAHSDAARLLLQVMRDVSEDYYCAGWIGGLEDELWRMVQGGDRRFGLGTVTEAEVADLRDLSTRAGGWWVWEWTDGDPQNSGPRFVPMDEWVQRAASAREQNGGRVVMGRRCVTGVADEVEAALTTWERARSATEQAEKAWRTAKAAESNAQGALRAALESMLECLPFDALEALPKAIAEAMRTHGLYAPGTRGGE